MLLFWHNPSELYPTKIGKVAARINTGKSVLNGIAERPDNGSEPVFQCLELIMAGNSKQELRRRHDLGLERATISVAIGSRARFLRVP
ncbi:MAG TPA: hypothetical protein VNT79_05750 [Phycisphaerae bacterium]|nr:hypothetical protein [Phycisphaerae bacterium]